MKKRSETHWNILAVFWLLCISFIFWRQLFIPNIGIIATPEFSGVESIDFGYATKYFYGNVLKHLELPIWAPSIGKGFPILGEGQTGIFYLPNLLFFSVFSVPTAYNLSIVFCSFVSSLGFYLFLKNHSINNTIALLFGTLFGNSAYFYLQAAHIPLIQGFSLLPWMFYAIDSYMRHKSNISLLFFSFLLSQQIFTGALQTVFISCSFVLVYALLFDNENRFQSLLHIGIYTFAGVMLSGIQLIPSIEFLSQIPNSGIQSNGIGGQFSFPIKHLLTYINPFIFGSPKNGTYDWNGVSGGSNYWENVGYFGAIPLLFLFTGFFVNKKIHSKPLWILLCLGFLLMLGSASPIYFLFHVWPFSLFRVPSRYIVPFTFLLISLCALYTNGLIKKLKKPFLKYGIYTMMLINMYIVFSSFTNYHRIIPLRQVSSGPQAAATFKNADVYYTYQNQKNWANEFITKGWSDETRIQLYESFLTANRNILYDRKNASFRSGRPLLKNSLSDQAIQELLFYEDSSTAAKLMQIQGVNTLISGYDLPQHNNISKIATVSSDPVISVYAITGSVPNFYVTGYLPYVARTVQQALSILENPKFQPGKHTVISEQSARHLKPTSSADFSYEPKVSYKNNNTIVITTHQSKTPGILVSTNTFYPGWTATINGKKATIFPVNINQFGIIVPEDPAQIIFEFKPVSLSIGAMVSFAGIIAAIVISVLLKRQ